MPKSRNRRKKINKYNQSALYAEYHGDGVFTTLLRKAPAKGKLITCLVKTDGETSRRRTKLLEKEQTLQNTIRLNSDEINLDLLHQLEVVQKRLSELRLRFKQQKFRVITYERQCISHIKDKPKYKFLTLLEAL